MILRSDTPALQSLTIFSKLFFSTGDRPVQPQTTFSRFGVGGGEPSQDLEVNGTQERLPRFRFGQLEVVQRLGDFLTELDPLKG